MPRKKEVCRKFFSYSEDDLRNAIKAVTENGMSKKTAAREFNVPRSTLIRKLTSLTPLRRKMGPVTELSEIEEKVLEKWIIAMARKGFPVHKQNLILSVKKILDETGRETKYLLNKTPGRSWFYGFLRRHPVIKQKYAESVSKARAVVTKDRIETWFDEILNFLKEGNYEEILKDPRRIFNADEAGFSLCPKSGKVLGPAANKEDFYVRVSSEKEQITVMATFSADGKYVPPMLIFPYKRVPLIIAESVPETWGLGKSDSGWMTSAVFYEYISNHFLSYLKSNDIQKPVILFVDGHRSHLTKEVSQLCDENGVILISLFPNTTHIMQPADVSVFRPLKAGWASEVRNWKFENFPKEVTRGTFGTILNSVFIKYASEKTIQNGFRKSGLFPFDKNNVDYSKCIPNRNVNTENEQMNTDTSARESSKQLLELLENKMDKKDLDQFLKTYSNNAEWSGDISFSKLYQIWAAIKKDNENDQNLRKTYETNSTEKRHEKDPIKDVHKSVTASKNSLIDEVINEKSPPKKSPAAGPSWYTPPERNISFYEDIEKQGYKVATPFKKCLVFPRTTEGLKTPKQKRKIFPAVVSSRKYREFYEREANKKDTKKSKKQTPIINDESTSESDIEIEYNDEDLDLPELVDPSPTIGQYVIVIYEEKYYPGIILKQDSEGAEVKTMVSAGVNAWKWPIKEDILYYFKEDIICIINEPQEKNNRGHYTIPEMQRYQ